MPKKVSLIIPVFNEEKNVQPLYQELSSAISKIDNYEFEIIFINDGSVDESLGEMQKLEKKDARINIIDFSRNFGKEMATTAGINHCLGEACLMLDADLQHPVEKISEFLAKWEQGAEIVVGVRKSNSGEGLIKKVGSYFFYKLINKIAEIKIIPNATDFRLLDRIVIDEFNKMTERNRMTRGLIDWMGFKREFVEFEANPRFSGKAGYSIWKLFRLAFNSIIAMSFFPLKLAGYLGVIITFLSGCLGIFIIITRYITGTMYFSGPAILAVIILFLIGIVLMCLGFIALYIANIYAEVGNRPIYIIRKKKIN